MIIVAMTSVPTFWDPAWSVIYDLTPESIDNQNCSTCSVGYRTLNFRYFLSYDEWFKYSYFTVFPVLYITFLHEADQEIKVVWLFSKQMRKGRSQCTNIFSSRSDQNFGTLKVVGYQINRFSLPPGRLRKSFSGYSPGPDYLCINQPLLGLYTKSSEFQQFQTTVQLI